MPTRIMREGLVDSDKVNSLSHGAEVFYVHLILKADDFGRFDARVPVLRSYLFPLRPMIRDTDMSRWIAECEKAGLIAVHGTANKRYIEVKQFNQRIRADKSKFPDPERDDGHMTVTCQSNDRQPQASVVCDCVVDCVCEDEEAEAGRQAGRARARAKPRHAAPPASQPPANSSPPLANAAAAEGSEHDFVLLTLIEEGYADANERALAAISRCNADGWQRDGKRVRNRVAWAVALAKKLEPNELESA